MAVATYTKTGTKATTAAKLDKAVFGVTPTNFELLKRVYDAYLANGRANHATTKTRGEVRGGGKKPWKQKGTGNARVGSRRNPIWRGGGIVFGPTGEENYSKQINTKAKRLAIRQALSIAADESRIAVIEDIQAKNGKTAELVNLLQKLDANKRVLVVVENLSDELVRASKNLTDVKVLQASYVNVYDAMNADRIIVTSGSLNVITQWLGAATPSTKGGDK
jgi:large subunit ribosomal protein L4